MQLTLMATTFLVLDSGTDAKVKHIYSLYKDICEKIGTDILSESRICDHINTLKMFGLIESSKKNLGRRGGRTFIYSLVDEPRIVLETFREDAQLEAGFPASTDQLLSQYEESSKSGFQSELNL